MENGGGEPDPLAKALGELPDGAMVDLLDSRRGDRLVQAAPESRPPHRPQAAHEVQVFGDQHLVVQRVVLRQVSDPLLGRPPGLGQGRAIQPDGPGIGLEVLGDHAHGGGLPGAVGPEKADHLPAIHGERHIIHGWNAVEALGNPFEREQRHTRVGLGVRRAGF